jgi:uncharacterized protein
MTHRREFITGLAALLCAPAWARAAAPTDAVRLAAAWQAGDGYQVGILEQAGDLSIRATIDVPTRAHALLLEPGGTLLAVARRPGDWLLRWDQDGKPLAWRWIEPRRAFTGHVISDGHSLYSTETDLDTGAGLIGVRDAKTLEKRTEWPTHGIDPHQLVWDGDGNILVANGGIPTQPESGRMKRNLERMDSSLVRLRAGTGERLGLWRLPDRRLSLRHLAWNGPLLGIALQAEHDDAKVQANAPVLALFDGQDLRPVAAPQGLAGYGGDISASGDGFAISCPRAQCIARYSAAAGWQTPVPLSDACALAGTAEHLWAGGRSQALTFNAREGRPESRAEIPGIRLDNHWISLRSSSRLN